VLERDPAGRVARATVVDFKSDRVEGERELEARAAAHAGQMRDYAQAAARLFDLSPGAVATLLLFTRVGRVRPVAADALPAREDS
jgi:hypothetical protein